MSVVIMPPHVDELLYLTLLEQPADYAACKKTLSEAYERTGSRSAA
jgi:hypothetical protein